MIKPISIEELQKANSPEDKIELTIKELQSLNENIYDLDSGTIGRYLYYIIAMLKGAFDTKE